MSRYDVTDFGRREIEPPMPNRSRTQVIVAKAEGSFCTIFSYLAHAEFIALCEKERPRRQERTVGGGANKRTTYRLGVAAAVLTSFLSLWAMVVRDDGNGAGFIMLIMAAAVGSAAASFQPAGMARAMLGVAAMQLLLGALVATAPSTASTPGGVVKILLFTVLFVALWLVSAAFFRAAAKSSRG